MTVKCYENKDLTKKYIELARFFRIIGDSNRLKILCLLKDNNLYVDELSSNLDLAQNLVSSHLKIMIDFGLLVVKQEGKKNYYSIDNKIFKKYSLLIDEFSEDYKR